MTLHDTPPSEAEYHMLGEHSAIFPVTLHDHKTLVHAYIGLVYRLCIYMVKNIAFRE